MAKRRLAKIAIGVFFELGIDDCDSHAARRRSSSSRKPSAPRGGPAAGTRNPRRPPPRPRQRRLRLAAEPTATGGGWPYRPALSDRAAGGAGANHGSGGDGGTPKRPVGCRCRPTFGSLSTPPYAENLLGWRVGGDPTRGLLQPMQEQLFQRDYVTLGSEADAGEGMGSVRGRPDVAFSSCVRERDIPPRRGHVRCIRLLCSAGSCGPHPEGKGATDWFHELLGPPGDLEELRNRYPWHHRGDRRGLG